MNFLRRLIFGRQSAKDSNLPRTDAGAAERVRLARSGESMQRVPAQQMMKKGGTVKKSSSGYRRAADGVAQRGKTRGKMV